MMLTLACDAQSAQKYIWQSILTHHKYHSTKGSIRLLMDESLTLVTVQDVNINGVLTFRPTELASMVIGLRKLDTTDSKIIQINK